MINKMLLVSILCGCSFAAQSVTIDLRHEYIDSGSNADRVSVSHRFANGLGFSVEAKWKSGGTEQDQPFADIIGNGHEEQISWRWKANDAIAVTPAFTIESNDSKTTYKPNLRLQYNFVNGFYVAARYRYEYTRYPDNSSKEDDKVNRGDAWLGMVTGNWRTELNYVYAKSEAGHFRNNNKCWSNEYNAKLAWMLNKNWAPYMEVGNVGLKTTSERQTRIRLGVAYSF